jgi:hypothetical protein
MSEAPSFERLPTGLVTAQREVADEQAPFSGSARCELLAIGVGVADRWANPIEAHFGPLRQFTLANSHHRGHPAQTQALHRYLRWRNTNARHPDVLTAQRKERARVRSEKGIRWGGRPLNTAA